MSVDFSVEDLTESIQYLLEVFPILLEVARRRGVIETMSGNKATAIRRQEL